MVVDFSKGGRRIRSDTATTSPSAPNCGNGASQSPLAAFGYTLRLSRRIEYDLDPGKETPVIDPSGLYENIKPTISISLAT